MARKLFYGLFTISLSLNCFGQWYLTDEIELPKKPEMVATDNQNSLYIGYPDGSLIKYNSQGQELLNYSLSNQSPITLIEPQFQLKTFLFYFDNQVITILDRFKGVPKNYAINDFTFGIVSMACPASDGSFWIVENNPALLKKIDPNRKSVVLETQPELGSDIRYMKVHQNILLILDENQLHIFDQFGSILAQLVVNSQHLTIVDDLAYLIDNKKVLKIDPFKGQILEEMESLVEDPDYFVFSGTHQLYIKDRQLSFYQWQD